MDHVVLLRVSAVAGIPVLAAELVSSPEQIDLMQIDPMLIDPMLQPKSSMLESFPYELRQQLLSLLDLQGLSALVHASPVFHEQYLRSRKFLLCNSLETTLGRATVDACIVHTSAAYRASTDYRWTRRGSQKVIESLKSYRDRRLWSNYSIHTEGLTENDAISMAAFHNSIITPLIRHYSGWALTNLSLEKNSVQSFDPLSGTELTRLTRALYRFQLCCILFSRRSTFGTCDKEGAYMSTQRTRFMKRFIGTLQPWEVQEIGCIYAFSNDKFDKSRYLQFNQAFFNILRGARERLVRQGGFEPWNSLEKKHVMKEYREYPLQGSPPGGLELLYTLLFTVKDHEHLVSVMKGSMTGSASGFLHEYVFGPEVPFLWRQVRPYARKAVAFEGDGQPEGKRPNPSLAWTLMCETSFKLRYQRLEHEDVRRWGYVMWDEARIKRSEADKVLIRQLEERKLNHP